MIPMRLPFQHLISAEQITRDVMGDIFSVAEKMEGVIAEEGRSELLKKNVIATLFYEPSSRTMLSFQVAAQRLGGGMILAQGREMSSMKKGETIEDTIRMVTSYADLIVMRHPESGAAEKAAKVCTVPFINSGDGGNEHPTQALLDLYTIQKEFGTLEGLHIALAGDLLYGRTVHSLGKLLARIPGTNLTLISPKELAMTDDVKKAFSENGVEYTETENLEEGTKADILYMTRVQGERFADRSEFERLKDKYILKADHLKNSKTKVMHPLPRINEISTDVDELPNALYFTQAKNGVPVRMALLAMMLGKA